MEGEIEPLAEEISSAYSPLEVFALFKDEPNSFLLDSSLQLAPWGRYSFIGYDPFLIFKSKKENIEIIEGANVLRLRGSPFAVLKSLLSQYRFSSPQQLPPFLGGAVGYFGYDLCGLLEELPSKCTDDLDLPDCYFGFYDKVIAFDHQQKRTWISSCGFPAKKKEEAKNRAQVRLREIKSRLIYISKQKIYNSLAFSGQNNLRLSSNFSKQDYLKAVAKAKEYIAKGDIFQVNLSQRLSVEEEIPAFELYRRMSAINPAPFASFLNLQGMVVVSASPERFLRISDRNVQTRPIKGTRPRGKDSLEDKFLAEELWMSEKDRAELVMIIDVERNDLGRVCEYGTIRVPELVTLETYPSVFHLVSTVEGVLREDKDHIDCLIASFPGGSITGAPKIRAMEIIEELEPTKRSIYTGSIGYLGFNAQTDLNIVIRTFLFTKGKVYFQVGGGIVADSIPEAEYEETLHKAKGLIDSLLGKELVTEIT